MDGQSSREIDPGKADTASSEQITRPGNLQLAQVPDLTGLTKPFSPWRFLFITIGGIALAEVIAMIVLTRFKTLPYTLQVVLDAGIMILLIFPVVYYFSLRPLLLHIQRRRQTAAALRQSEERFARVFHFSPIALSVTRMLDGCFIDVNDSFLQMYGGKREDLIGHTSVELGIFPNPDERADLSRETRRRQALGQEGIRNYELHARVASGDTRTVLLSTEGLVLGGEACILSSLSDITERMRDEERLRRAYRALSVLNSCNELLVVAETEGELLHSMCEVLVNVGKYRMAWVGFADQDEARSVRPAAQSAFDDGYLSQARISWADDEWGRGPTGTAVRQGTTQVNQDFQINAKMQPWRENALRRGYQSSIALPLKDGRSTFGALTIYSAAPDAFDEDEVHLLNELADNLGFGIRALRLHAEQARAEADVRRLSSIVEQTADSVVVTDRNGRIEYVNPSFERLTGYTREESVGKTPRLIKSGLHDEDFYGKLWNTILQGEVFQGQIANRKKGGELFYEMKTIAPLRDAEGNITHFVATGKDITEEKYHEEQLAEAYRALDVRVQERTHELRIANSELEDEISVRKRGEQEIQRYADELRAGNAELTRFNEAMVGREMRMIELKREVNALCRQAGRPPRYSLDLEKEAT